MRILVLNHNASGRGTWHRAFPFGRELARLGHDVRFCCVHPHRLYRGDERTISCGEDKTLTLYESPGWSGFQDRQEGRGILDLIFRRRLILRQPVDVVWAFSHKLNCAGPARLARKKWGARFISDWCDRWGGVEGLFAETMARPDFQALPPWTRWARQRAFHQEAILEEKVRRNDADAVTVISRALRERALGLGVPSERLALIGSGADLDRFQPADKDECRSRLGLKNDKTWLAYFANFHSDPLILIEAVIKILDRYPQICFAHSGAPLEALPPGWKRLCDLGRIVSLGWIASEMMPALTASADILILPLSGRRLNVERFPHKLTDYLSAGRPVAACDVGDVSLFIQEGRNGALCLPTADGLAKGVARLMERQEDWDAMGVEARTTAEGQMNWRKKGKEAHEFLEKILQAPALK